MLLGVIFASSRGDVFSFYFFFLGGETKNFWSGEEMTIRTSSTIGNTPPGVAVSSTSSDVEGSVIL